MSKYLLFMAVIASMVVLPSCNKAEEPDPNPNHIMWDYAPIFLRLMADDGEHDLFDPDYEGNILQQVSVTYKGVEYFYTPATDASTPSNKFSLRHYAAIFKGLYLERYLADSPEDRTSNYLQFGDFEPCRNYSNELFVVNWPDGHKDYFAWIWFYKPGSPASFSSRITLNGEKQDYFAIRRTITTGKKSE